MAKDFCVSESFIDSELSKFIGTSHLNCQIDRNKNIVENYE